MAIQQTQTKIVHSTGWDSMNNRAQSIGLARTFLALGVFAILYFIIDRITTPLLNHSTNATSNATANQATEWFRQGIGLLPAFVLVLAFFSVTVYAIYVREVR